MTEISTNGKRNSKQKLAHFQLVNRNRVFIGSVKDGKVNNASNYRLESSIYNFINNGRIACPWCNCATKYFQTLTYLYISRSYATLTMLHSTEHTTSQSNTLIISIQPSIINTPQPGSDFVLWSCGTLLSTNNMVPQLRTTRAYSMLFVGDGVCSIPIAAHIFIYLIESECHPLLLQSLANKQFQSQFCWWTTLVNCSIQFCYNT